MAQQCNHTIIYLRSNARSVVFMIKSHVGAISFVFFIIPFIPLLNPPGRGTQGASGEDCVTVCALRRYELSQYRLSETKSSNFRSLAREYKSHNITSKGGSSRCIVKAACVAHHDLLAVNRYPISELLEFIRRRTGWIA